MSTEIDEDAFLGFIEYARSVLWSEDDNVHGSDKEGGGGEGEIPSYSTSPPWSWIVSRVLKVCKEYPSGVTKGILLSDLSQVSILHEFICLLQIPIIKPQFLFRFFNKVGVDF